VNQLDTGVKGKNVLNLILTFQTTSTASIFL